MKKLGIKDPTLPTHNIDKDCYGLHIFVWEYHFHTVRNHCLRGKDQASQYSDTMQLVRFNALDRVPWAPTFWSHMDIFLIPYFLDVAPPTAQDNAYEMHVHTHPTLCCNLFSHALYIPC